MVSLRVEKEPQSENKKPNRTRTLTMGEDQGVASGFITEKLEDGLLFCLVGGSFKEPHRA